jgi:hypothetical protein
MEIQFSATFHTSFKSCLDAGQDPCLIRDFLVPWDRRGTNYFFNEAYAQNVAEWKWSDISLVHSLEWIRTEGYISLKLKGSLDDGRFIYISKERKEGKERGGIAIIDDPSFFETEDRPLCVIPDIIWWKIRSKMFLFVRAPDLFTRKVGFVDDFSAELWKGYFEIALRLCWEDDALFLGSPEKRSNDCIVWSWFEIDKILSVSCLDTEDGETRRIDVFARLQGKRYVYADAYPADGTNWEGEICGKVVISEDLDLIMKYQQEIKSTFV